MLSKYAWGGGCCPTALTPGALGRSLQDLGLYSHPRTSRHSASTLPPSLLGCRRLGALLGQKGPDGKAPAWELFETSGVRGRHSHRAQSHRAHLSAAGYGQQRTVCQPSWNFLLSVISWGGMSKGYRRGLNLAPALWLCLRITELIAQGALLQPETLFSEPVLGSPPL